MAGTDQDAGGTTLTVPVLDVHMQEVHVPGDVAVPAVPPMPQLPPPPSLEQILQSLHLDLPRFSAPATLYDGVVPPPPPLDMAALLSPLSSAMDLLGSGVLDDIQTLAGEDEGAGFDGGVPRNDSGLHRDVGLGSGMSPQAQLGNSTYPGSAAQTAGGHPLSKLNGMGDLLSSSIERGQRALRELENHWRSGGSDAAVATGQDVERSKQDLRDQGARITTLTTQAAAIIASGRAQLTAVATRLSIQLAALAPVSFTPWGQAAIVSAIAAASAESSAIIAATEAQLAPLTQQMLIAANPVEVPQPPQPHPDLAQVLQQLAQPAPRVPEAQGSTQMASTQMAGPQILNTGQQSDLMRRGPVPYSGASRGATAVGGSPKQKAALSLAKHAIAAFQKHIGTAAGATMYSGAAAGALPRSTPSPTRSTPPITPLGVRPSVRPTSANGATTNRVAGTSGANAAPSAPEGPTALPTYTASASGFPSGGAAAAPAAGTAASAGGTAPGQGMMPMAPMGGAGAAGAAGAGGDDRHKVPAYLISASNGEEILGDRRDVAPAVLGVVPMQATTTEGATGSHDSSRLNL